MKYVKSTQIRKYKIIALLLNIFIGTGHIYIGKYKRAFFFSLSPLLLLIIGSFIEQYIDFTLLCSIFLVVILYLYSFIDIWQSFSTAIKDEKKLRYSKWYYIILFILFNGISQSILNIDMLPTRHFSLPASSMNNTLFKGDYIVARKNNNLNRGNIALFRNPLTPDIYFAKRVVAIGDDEIIYQDKKLFIHFHEGDEYIKKHFPSTSIHTIRKKLWVQNPYKLSNPNIIYNPKQFSMFDYLLVKNDYMQAVYIEKLSIDNDSNKSINAFYKKVEKDSYYMMGDNRDNSNDSRLFGSVPKAYVYGILKNVYFNYRTWNRFYIEVK